MATQTRSPLTDTTPSSMGPTTPAPRLPSLWWRVRRILLLACVIVLVPVAVSYTSAMLRSSNTGFGIRSVEWLRDHGASKLVSWVEDTYYTLTAPSKGGPSLKALPTTAGTAMSARRAHRVRHFYLPPRIHPVIHPALPGEGVWHAPFVDRHIPPPVLITTFRPEPDYPQLVAGVAWMRASTTRIRYIPGVTEPSVPVARGSTVGEIPPLDRGRVVAAFNGGFKLTDTAGGFFLEGHTWRPMINGIGTLVQYRSGRFDVIDWTHGANVPGDIVLARQNSPMMIDHGRLQPGLGSGGEQWGFTVNNAVQVWRSGIGVDRHGNLLYAAANYQTVSSLAQILKRAGAVRALELDINQDWISFITYRHPGARGAAQLLPDIERPADRYLTADDRDFFAVFLKR